ncbi:MAG: hypothetical protein K6V73_12090 [Firmicutes bacterium]|nr:hypothetical protein [Bacillota bacterium]
MNAAAVLQRTMHGCDQPALPFTLPDRGTAPIKEEMVPLAKSAGATRVRSPGWIATFAWASPTFTTHVASAGNFRALEV